MGLESIEQFRERVSEDDTLQPAFLEAFAQGPAALSQLGKTQGFDFSEADASQAISELSKSGELSDFELEMVSGGIIRGTTLGGAPSGENVTVNLDTGSTVSPGTIYASTPAAPTQSSGGGGK